MKNNALIIFDWDDTLFPTSWIMNSGIKLNDENNVRKIIVYLNELDINISRLLKSSILLGKVIIVTNAGIDWIMLTKKYLPKTKFIIDNYVKVISARDIYHHAYGIEEWKKNVFKKDILDLVDWAEQIISFGDAYYEFNALISLYGLVPKKTCLKNIKLLHSPSFENIIDQLDVINNSIKDIVKKPMHLDLNFEKK